MANKSSKTVSKKRKLDSYRKKIAKVNEKKNAQKQINNFNSENEVAKKTGTERMESPIHFLNLDYQTQNQTSQLSKLTSTGDKERLNLHQPSCTNTDIDNHLEFDIKMDNHPFLKLCQFGSNSHHEGQQQVTQEVHIGETVPHSEVPQPKKRSVLCQKESVRKRYSEENGPRKKRCKVEADGMKNYNIEDNDVSDLEIENEEVFDEDIIDGHRIIQIDHFFNELRKISSHNSLFSCELNSLKIISEKRSGLMSEFTIQCQMCQKKFEVKNSSTNLNKNAVSGMMSAGCGHQQLNQFAAAVDLPSMSEYAYNKAHDQVCNEWELTAWAEMKKAGERERDAAIKEGRVNKDGVAMIDVEIDGSWCKRSYKTNYSASSGSATIIGRRFKQVLFMCVKNKYCCICARAEKRNETVKEHSCYKNFTGPSTAMEANIIVEGFKQSLEMHNLIYSRFVADGDCSTYAKILEARPYPNITVEKINCKNHILRNFCNKLQQLKTDTKYSVKERKILTNEKILRTRKYITEAMKFHGRKIEEPTEKIKSLHKDITVSIYHGFGFHFDCTREICTHDTETNPEITTGPLWQRMKFIIANVASHARSLIENVDSNLVESFNGVIAKFIGGKRVNYALRRSYQARCAGAVIEFNTKRILSTVEQNIHQQQPGARLKKFEDAKLKKLIRNRNAGRRKKRYVIPKKLDNNYGENADKPDMDADTFELSKKIFLETLKKTKQERRDIEKRTVLQSDCGEWMELRRNLLTASNFGKVVKRNIKNSCRNMVKNMLYKVNIDHVTSIAHGKKYEKTALTQLSNLLNVQIEECGLFIDEEYPFLGATPDGIITNQDTIVEIKCPILPYKIGIDEAIKQGKMHFWRVNKQNGEIITNTRSDWYMQIQGQMHISKIGKCILGVWYGDDKIKTEIIQKDDQFWRSVMEPKLKSFYFDCLLPELVDPRFTRNRPIRDPDYVKPKKSKENIDSVKNDNETTEANNINLLSTDITNKNNEPTVTSCTTDITNKNNEPTVTSSTNLPFTDTTNKINEIVVEFHNY